VTAEAPHNPTPQDDSYRLRLESILDNIVDGLITIDEKGAIQSFNKACERMFGYAAAEVLGRNVNMLMPEPYAGQHDGYIKNYRDTGRAKIIGIGREVEARRKDGGTFPIDLSVAEVNIGGQRIFSGIVRDITERKKAEKTSALLSALVESSSDAIISKTLDGVITSWNKGAEQVFGYASSEAVGRNINMVIPPERLPEETRIIGQLARGESIDHFETLRRRKDGKDIPVSLTVSPIFGPGGAIIGASKVARDMTERNLQDEQLRHAQKMEAVGQLTSGVAHDFNNLLTVVLGNTRLIRKMMAAQQKLPVFADIAERIQDIDTAAHRGADLVRRLMIFTRQRPLQKTVVDVNACVEETHGLLARVLGEHIKVRVVAGKDAGCVRIDQDQFINAFINLAANARDAMPQGGTLTIETGRAALGEKDKAALPELAPGDYTFITVSDTGTGMPEHIKARIFEPFFTTKPAGQGTGLGLSMIYGLIRDSGGYIQVDSAPGRGTTFRIYLPPCEPGVKSA
jgi:PAS domain S-box-containing protein